MDPIKWFQQNVINRGVAAAAPKGGAIVPVTAGQLLNPNGIQQITTNLKVPGGARVPGGGIGMFGARGQNFGIIDKPIDAIAGEAVRGAMVVTGQDTSGYDKFRAGKPVVKNVGNKSFNVATPEGQSGYKKAIQAGEKKSTPQTVATRRDVPAPDESAGKGTSMGSSVLQMDEVNKYLNNRGIPSLADPFSSNNLPGIDYSAEDAAVMRNPEKGSSRPQLTKAQNAQLDQEDKARGLGLFPETTIDGSKPPVTVIQRQGSPELVENGAISAGNNGNTALPPVLTDVLGNKIGGENGSPATAGFDMARRRAFLDAKDQFDGMRAVKAQKGMATFEGQSYITDPNNDGQMMAISQDDKRTLLGRDQQKAQDLLGSYVKLIKPEEEDPAV
jgi:hypothetical protein